MGGGANAVIPEPHGMLQTIIMGITTLLALYTLLLLASLTMDRVIVYPVQHILSRAASHYVHKFSRPALQFADNEKSLNAS